MARKPPARAAAPAAAQPIVSSAHLVSPRSAEMSEFEFGLIVAGNAFHRWVVHCMAAAGLKEYQKVAAAAPAPSAPAAPARQWKHAD